MLIAAAAVAALLAAGDQASLFPEPQSAVPPEAAPAVSLERVREGLDRPNVLKLPNPDEMAYFRATIEEPFVIDGVLEAMRRDLAAWRGSPISAPTSRPAPLVVGMDVIPLARAFLKWRAERQARRTVDEALHEFCATHDCSVLEGGAPVEGVSMPRFQPSSSPAPSQ